MAGRGSGVHESEGRHACKTDEIIRGYIMPAAYGVATPIS